MIILYVLFMLKTGFCKFSIPQYPLNSFWAFDMMIFFTHAHYCISMYQHCTQFLLLRSDQSTGYPAWCRTFRIAEVWTWTCTKTRLGSSLTARSADESFWLQPCSVAKCGLAFRWWGRSFATIHFFFFWGAFFTICCHRVFFGDAKQIVKGSDHDRRSLACDVIGVPSGKLT